MSLSGRVCSPECNPGMVRSAETSINRRQDTAQDGVAQLAGVLLNILRLARAGLVLAQHGVHLVPKGMALPPPIKAALVATAPIRWLSAPFRVGTPQEKRISSAIAALGPSYIKLGQFLATRADVIGPELAKDLSHLQDRMAPFSMEQARHAIETALGGRLEDHYTSFGPPVAAASIAQVHKA